MISILYVGCGRLAGWLLRPRIGEQILFFLFGRVLLDILLQPNLIKYVSSYIYIYIFTHQFIFINLHWCARRGSVDGGGRCQ